MVSGQNAYRLDAAGKWQKIVKPGTEPVRAGEAYWVYCKGASSYTGPVTVKLDQAGEVNFGRFLQRHRVQFTNHSSAEVKLTVNVAGAGSAPAGQGNMTAGPVPLSYWRIDLGNEDPAANFFGWDALDAPLSNAIRPGASWPLQVSVRRADMTSTVEDLAGDARYRSILNVTSDSGMTFRIPVISEGLASRPRVAKDGDAGGEQPDRAGLWVGYVGNWAIKDPNAKKEAEPYERLPTDEDDKFQQVKQIELSIQDQDKEGDDVSQHDTFNHPNA